MPKITVYVPEEVARVLGKHKKDINVSEVCQQALRREIEKKTQLLIVSQNARLANLSIPAHAVLRVNVAWVRSREELAETLGGIQHDVFLDLPEGRKKPPRPVLKFSDLLDAMRLHKRVRYFGATDVRDAAKVRSLLRVLPPGVQLVPKIESKAGVRELDRITAALPYKTRYIMLDKEDLYTDLAGDNDAFLEHIQQVRERCWRNHVHVLELAGVIFLSDMRPPAGVEP